MDTVLDFKSRHFMLHTLAEGAYAAIPIDGGAAICNAGLVDLGGKLVVFDSFMTPQAAHDLRRFCLEHYNRAPDIVINSHYHNDHIWGNQVYAADASIYASTRTRQLISTAGMEEFQEYQSISADRLAAWRAQYEAASEAEKQNTLLWIGYYEGLVEAFPTLTVCLPDITFDGRLEFHGARRTVQLITFENAHTGSDTVLYLPEDGIVFMSDLLFVGCHPYLGDGDAFGMLAALRELTLLDAATYVPGHGPVGNKTDVTLLAEYIEDCIQTARQLVDSGDATEERIRALPVPARYRDWIVPRFYPANIIFLCERLAAAPSPSQ